MRKTSARLLALLSLLQARREWPGALLAERLDVSPRTVRRDVDRLRELGYPVAAVKGPDGGYRLGAGTELPPLLFDDDQAVALAVALQTAAMTGAGIEEAAARALTTVRQVLPARLRHRIDALRITAVDRPGNVLAPQADTEVLLALSTAVRARETLRFDYRAPDHAPASRPGTPPPPRRAEPHHLVTWGGRWYLVAWDLDREDWRTFRVDRLTPRIPTGPRFTPRELPGGDVTAYVATRFRGAHHPDSAPDWPCRGEVVLHRPAPEVAGFAHDGVVEELAPDRCRLTLGSWSWPSLAALIGRFDADFEIVGPPELSAAFARLGRRYAQAAARSTPGTPGPPHRPGTSDAHADTP
ncbi:MULTISPECIES: helix-turn-helix transcriptional regulator [Streptomyces]|uniref:DeoR family transcriptional regulator n=1 Tax=Streptomyces diastaticus subsp. diastaticus TaxID=68040 RepID=A0ABQ1CJ76_STRDI|nr:MULTISPECIES: WYL domain-containing protein [Streptomyces]NEE29646.1 WYL domain-containing protein [Streptomyces sp. SID7982]WSU37010.1 WYL domain-containing protein [Streptomyces gougerotii]MDQ0294525.1 putative DNA-binding transcriptional regulator YafY [Streptomyces sp. DSM 41037]WPR51889.1 WYL domain-containing protein [Streptomyces sp. S399]GFH70467.1 DeoR family transcriptional regulator [Streptomyces diastaticus subsp. diastaticus]